MNSDLNLEIGPPLRPEKSSSSFNSPIDPEFLLDDAAIEEYSDLDSAFGSDVDDEDIQMDDNTSDAASNLDEEELAKEKYEPGMLSSLVGGNTSDEYTGQEIATTTTIAHAISVVSKPRKLELVTLETSILQYITTMLPLSSVTALALTCHFFYDVVIDRRCLTALKDLRSLVCLTNCYYFPHTKPHKRTEGSMDVQFPDYTLQQRTFLRRVFRKMLFRRERKALLKLLDRDLPSYLNCLQCGFLHSVLMPTSKGVELSSYTNMRLARCDSEGIPPGHFPYKTKTYPQISKAQIRLAIKHFQSPVLRDPLINGLLQSSRTIVNESGRFLERKHLWLSTPKIIDNKLFVRSQHWFLLPRPTPGTSTHGTTLQDAVNPFLLNRADEFTAEILICPHVQMETIGYYAAVEDRTMEPIIDHCCKCTMNYQIDAKDYYPSGFAFIITTWCDLGSFLFEDPSEYMMIVARSRQPYRKRCTSRRFCSGHKSQLGEQAERITKKAFEGSNEFKCENGVGEDDRNWLFGKSVAEMNWLRWQKMKP